MDNLLIDDIHLWRFLDKELDNMDDNAVYRVFILAFV